MGALSKQSRPVLWQLDISHYSEKVRWALDYKEVDHVRRSPFPGMHIAIALGLTGGAAKTFPILQIDGRTLACSRSTSCSATRTCSPTSPRSRCRRR